MHPGGGPDTFFGSEPGSTNYTPTADEKGLPWPNADTVWISDDSVVSTGAVTLETIGEASGVAVSADVEAQHPHALKHERTQSEDSIDPLHWSVEQFQEEIAGLEGAFGEAQIHDPLEASLPIYVETFLTENKQVYFTAPDGQQFTVDVKDWSKSFVFTEDEQVDCLLYVPPFTTGGFYTFKHKDGGGLQQKGKGTENRKNAGGRKRRR